MQICGFAASGGLFSGKYAVVIFLLLFLKVVLALASAVAVQLVLSPTMTSAQVVKMSVTVNNSPIQENTHSDNHIQSTYDIIAEPN